MTCPYESVANNRMALRSLRSSGIDRAVTKVLASSVNDLPAGDGRPYSAAREAMVRVRQAVRTDGLAFQATSRRRFEVEWSLPVTGVVGIARHVAERSRVLFFLHQCNVDRLWAE